MKKIFIIIGTLILAALLAWFLLPGSRSPVEEVIRNGLPFGSGEDINIPAVDNEQQAINNKQFDENINSETKLFRISNTPVAGFVILTNKVRYVERATGHIFEVNLGTNAKTRLTNQTLPKIYEAHFRSDGSAVLLRSLDNSSDTVENLTLVLTPPKATSTELYSISATNMRGGIDSVVPGSDNLLYYVLADTGAVISSTFTGTKLKTLFSSAFTDWRLSRLGTGVMLYTKASSDAPGYAYGLSGSSLNKLAGPLNGLTAIGSSDGKKILYSYFENNSTKLFAKDISKNNPLELLPSTLAEKCAWNNKSAGVVLCGIPVNGITGKEPDNWYQGKSHFSDYIWKFDTNSEIAQLIVEPKTSFGVDLDVYEPQISADDSLMIFINKRDMTLWGVRLN